MVIVLTSSRREIRKLENYYGSENLVRMVNQFLNEKWLLMRTKNLFLIKMDVKYIVIKQIKMDIYYMLWSAIWLRCLLKMLEIGF